MLDEAEKRTFDAMFEMCRLAWGQFNERRQYEVRMTLSFWTALAAAVAGSLTLTSLPALPGGRIALLAVGAGAVALHAFWCQGMGRAQRANFLVAVFWEREIQALLGRQFHGETQRFLAELRPRAGILRNWTYVLQMGVTVLLAAALVAANWNRFGTDDEARRRALELKRMELEIQQLERDARP